MPDFQDILGVTPWAIVVGLGGWVGALLRSRGESRKIELTHEEVLDAARTELTFQLLSSAREDLTAARGEMEELRGEVTSLRSLEIHFFHFQQALDHIEAILRASKGEEKATAERNAQAFLNRMRRLQDAKGTLANEAQVLASSVEIAGDKLKDAG